jgi:PAS domain S-box-containing protein
VPSNIDVESSARAAESDADFYQKLVELSPDVVCIHVAGTIVYVNQAGLDFMHASSLDQVLGRSILDFVHPDYQPVVSQRQQVMGETGAAVPRIEERFVGIDGTVVDGEVAAVPFTYRGKAATLVVIQDVTQRKRIEDDLARSRDQLQVILQTVNDGITVQAASGELIYANAAAARIIGFPSVEALLSTPLTEMMHHFEMVDEAGNPVPVEALPGRQVLMGMPTAEAVLGSRILETGERRWSLVKAAPILDEQGTVTSVVNVFQDITQRTRRLAEEQTARTAAETAQRRSAFLAEAGNVLASSLDYEVTLASVARLAVAEIADWCVVDVIQPDGTPERVVAAHADPAREEWAREVVRRYPPDERSATEAVRAALQPVLMPDVSDEVLVSAARDEDHLRILRELGMRSLITVPLNARGKLLGSITFILAESGRKYGPDDLTFAQELAQRAALAVDSAWLYRESVRVAAEREAILAHMVEGIAITDAAGRVIFANRASERMVGAIPLGESVEEYAEIFQFLQLDGSPYPTDQLPLARAMRGEVCIGVRWRVIGPSGQNLVIQGSAAPVKDDAGSLLGAVLTFRDITSEFELEQQKDGFLSLVSHELRTPVTVIQGFVQLMQRELQGTDERTQRRLRTVGLKVSQLTTLINDLLDLSRIESGRLECICLPLDYWVTLESVCDEMRTLRSDRIIKLHAPRDLQVVGDALRLRQVLVNLIDNAFKYGPEGTEVTITVEEDGDTVTTYVCDEGPPLPVEVRDTVFDRFYRGAQKYAEGLGIGLYISRGIIEAHGGRIWVADDDHSSFAFSLPVPKSLQP